MSSKRCAATPALGRLCGMYSKISQMRSKSGSPIPLSNFDRSRSLGVPKILKTFIESYPKLLV